MQKTIEDRAELEERSFTNFSLGRVEDRARLTEGSNGVIVPVSIANRIVTEVKDMVPFLQLADVINTNGKLAVQDDVNNHKSDKSNPHLTTKEQVGRGNVPNVTTDNQSPTFTQATVLSSLLSGETLTISLGKLSKAITDLIDHKKDLNNPHKTTAKETNALPLSGGRCIKPLDCKANALWYGIGQRHVGSNSEWGRYGHSV